MIFILDEPINSPRAFRMTYKGVWYDAVRIDTLNDLLAFQSESGGNISISKDAAIDDECMRCRKLSIK